MSKHTVARIREFNRFYVSVIGATNNSFLQTGLSLTEARIIFETDKNPGITARQLKEILKIDEGYLSRLVAKLVKQKLLLKKQVKEDKRIFSLELSEKGKQKATDLNQRSDEDVARSIQHLSANEKKELSELLSAVKRLLTRAS